MKNLLRETFLLVGTTSLNLSQAKVNIKMKPQNGCSTPHSNDGYTNERRQGIANKNERYKSKEEAEPKKK